MKLPPWIQLYATLVLAAHVVAWYGLRRLDVPYWLGLAGVTAVLVVLCEVLIRRLPKQMEDLFEKLDRIPQSEAESELVRSSETQRSSLLSLATILLRPTYLPWGRTPTLTPDQLAGWQALRSMVERS